MPSHRISRLAAFSLLILLLMLAACAANLDGPQRARLTAHEFSRQYLQLRQQYAEAMEVLPPEARESLRSKAAPVLNKLKRCLIAYNEAAIRWSAQQAQPGVAGPESGPESGQDSGLQPLSAEIVRLSRLAATLILEVSNDRH